MDSTQSSKVRATAIARVIDRLRTTNRYFFSHRLGYSIKQWKADELEGKIRNVAFERYMWSSKINQ